MKNIGFYIVDKGADNNAIRNIFTKYRLHSIDQVRGENPDLGKDKTAYLDSNPGATFGKFMGVAEQYGLTTLDKANAMYLISRRETDHLQEIAETMGKENYEKKIDKFNSKKVSIQRKLNDAKDEVMGTSGYGSLSSVTATAMLEKFDNCSDQLQGDSKISKQQAKLDKHLTKNKVLNDSQAYTKQPLAMGMGQTLIDFGVSAQLAGANPSISGALENARNQSPIEEAFTRFKELVKELLPITKEVGIMIASDDRHVDIKNVKKFKLETLRPEEFIFAKEGDIIYIS